MHGNTRQAEALQYQIIPDKRQQHNTGQDMTVRYNAIQDTTRHGKTRPYNTRTDNTRHDNTVQYRQDMKMHDGTRHDKAIQCNTICKTSQLMTIHDKAIQANTRHDTNRQYETRHDTTRQDTAT